MVDSCSLSLVSAQKHFFLFYFLGDSNFAERNNITVTLKKETNKLCKKEQLTD